MAKPEVNPVEKPITKKDKDDVAPTPEKAKRPKYCPTIIESTKL